MRFHALAGTLFFMLSYGAPLSAPSVSHGSISAREYDLTSQGNTFQGVADDSLGSIEYLAQNTEERHNSNPTVAPPDLNCPADTTCGYKDGKGYRLCKNNKCYGADLRRVLGDTTIYYNLCEIGTNRCVKYTPTEEGELLRR